MAARLKRQPNKVLYLYGITRGASTDINLRGVDGSSTVETVVCGSMTCWVSRVPAPEFTDDLFHNIENLDWLAEKSTQHQKVVSEIARDHDILPARFGTVFLTEPSLCADVHSKRKTLALDFARIEDSEEWGVKVFLLPAKAPLATPGRSGKEYLQSKSAILQKRRAAAPDEEVGRFAEELQKLAVEVAEGGRITGGRRDLQYQTSLLLKRSDRKKFEGLLRKYSKTWKDQRHIEATGPWPPYSFVSRSPHEAN
jgi:hypothetical protein